MPQPFEFDYTHLTPYEPAARIFCGMQGQEADEDMEVQHPMLAGVTLKRPAWHFAAEALINLSMMLAAMEQARRQAAQPTQPAQH